MPDIGIVIYSHRKVGVDLFQEHLSTYAHRIKNSGKMTWVVSIADTDLMTKTSLENVPDFEVKFIYSSIANRERVLANGLVYCNGVEETDIVLFIPMEYRLNRLLVVDRALAKIDTGTMLYALPKHHSNAFILSPNGAFFVQSEDTLDVPRLLVKKKSHLYILPDWIVEGCWYASKEEG